MLTTTTHRLPAAATIIALTLAGVALGLPAASRPVAPDERPVDFVRDIRPILAAKCFACHGPDEAARKGDLSLVDFESATRRPIDGNPAVVPFDPEASELWRRISDLDDPMPPRSAHDPLDDRERRLLRRWIEEGGLQAPHWAYETPRRHPIPRDPFDASALDAFLAARQAEEGLDPSPPADRTTLLRRLSFDLVGLPPTPAAIDAYVTDDRPSAFQRNVDRLLDSPYFGERLAVLWLDLVRYADTVGYHGDQEHRVWPYRDWVIEAFNQDLPFDEFTRLQLAGDLVAAEAPGLNDQARQQAMVASGYNRLLQTSHEGGLQLEEYRAIYMADRVRNASETWMGGTLGCAQCHDHKYDPYTQRDFHTFGAFFADIDDEQHLRDPYDGYNTTPTRREPELRVMTGPLQLEIDRIQSQLGLAEKRLAETERLIRVPDPTWERSCLDQIVSGRSRVEVWVDDHPNRGGQLTGDWTSRVEPSIPPASGAGYRVQRNPGRVQHYTVNAIRSVMVEPGSMLATWIHLDPKDPPKALMLQVHADDSWEHRAVWGSDAIDFGRTAEDTPSYRRQGPLPSVDQWHRLEVTLESLGLEAGQMIDGLAFTQFGGTARWDAAEMVHPSAIPAAVAAGIQTPIDARTDAQREMIARYRIASDPGIATIKLERERLLRQVEERRRQAPLTLYTRALEQPRPVRILPRGDWLDQSGELVEPAIPAFLGILPRRHADRPRADRLDLANWLVRPVREGGVGELTARVFVNRIWAMLMGSGLCPSLEDFGGQGRPPTHPELLDHLALDFIESGWSIKDLVRRIVSSDSYARSSRPIGETATLDPDNLFHARQSRHRLAAEFVRDAALHAGGLLQQRQGGPSIKPPQPEGHYRHLNFPLRRYEADTDAEQWRRGVYVHWQRQFLHPMLKAFDAPTREACTTSRTVSNTPLAALVLLNDPVFLQAARGLARRVLTTPLANSTRDPDEFRLVAAWRIAVGRRPAPRELTVLENLLSRSRSEFALAPERAEALLGIGVSEPDPRARDQRLPAPEFAAWTQTCRAILNLHETYTRE